MTTAGAVRTMHGRLRGALWRHRLLALLTLALVVLVGVVLLQRAPKTYDASVDVGVDPEVPSAVQPGDDPRAEADMMQRRAALVAAVGSDDVAAAVAGRLGVPRSTEQVRRALQGTWVPGTTLLHLTAEDRDPVVAARMVNAAALVLPDQAAADPFDLRTLQRAQPPTRWSSPDPLLSLGGVALGAVLLAAAGALWRDRRDRPVDDGAAVEEATSAPLLAHVRVPDDPTDLPALDPGSADAAVFRRLREALADAQGAAGAAGPGSTRVVVAGISAPHQGREDDGEQAHPADDGVWLGANLAIALADGGDRVLLVDGRLGERFGARSPDEPDTPGLYDVLRGTPLDHALSPGPTPGLTVLPSGGWGAQRPDLLVDTRFAQVMASAGQRFDVVVVLAPPLESSDDARAMAAGGSLVLAVGEDEISAHDLRAHTDRLRAVGARLLGTVLVARTPAGAMAHSS